tara:strand:- start:7960 stop:8202 length:243 start_codon:yes stop_codon:yes gene_type:complete
MYYTTVEIDFLEMGYESVVEVEFSVDGKYYPATMTDPEEFPELEVLAVTYAGDCVVVNLTDEHDEIISKACWESLEEGEM